MKKDHHQRKSYRTDYDISASRALDIVRDSISKACIEVNDSVDDGRIGSAISENKITDFMANSKRLKAALASIGYTLHIPSIRCWYDFYLNNESENRFVPINIKISSLKPHIPEATHARYGLLYSMLGVKIDEFKKVSWDKYWDYFKSFGNRRTDKDYYFLIIDKGNPKDVFYTSMKTMRSIRASAVNLPFQAIWSDNRDRDFTRSPDEVYSTIYSCLAHSMRLMENTAKSGIIVMDRFSHSAQARCDKNKKIRKARHRK